MENERAGKMRRLESLRRAVPHASASALTAVLDDIQKAGMPDLRNRNHFREATSSQMLAKTPYGPLLCKLQLHAKDGSLTPMHCINPLALLWTAFAQGGSITNAFETLLVTQKLSSENPWRLIFYADEVVPGNVISYDNRRKVWVVYFSFMELGQVRLQMEDSWFCVLASRYGNIANLAGGISQVMAAVMKLFFKSLHDISAVGIALKSPSGQHHRLFADVGMLLQEGERTNLCFTAKAIVE